MQSWQPCGTSSAKHLKFFNSEFTKMNKRITFTEKKFLLKLFARTREMQSDQPCWNIFAKFLEKIGWNSQAISKDKYTVFFKNFFLKKFPWTSRLRFWRPSRKFAARSWIIVCGQSPKKIKNIIFYKKILKAFHWRRQMQFRQAWG